MKNRRIDPPECSSLSIETNIRASVNRETGGVRYILDGEQIYMCQSIVHTSKASVTRGQNVLRESGVSARDEYTLISPGTGTSRCNRE